MKSDETGFTCCICRKHIVGESGNNPWPLRNMSEECCNDCNKNYVVPSRMLPRDVLQGKRSIIHKTPYIYPYIEEADDKLRKIAFDLLSERVDEELKESAIKELETELRTIELQGSASGFLIMHDLLKSVDARADEFIFRGVMPSLLLAYILGFSEINPMTCKPKLYSCIHFGVDGKKTSAFEITVTPQLHKRIESYFDNYPFNHQINRRFDRCGEIIGIKKNMCTGVFIGEDKPCDAYNSFYINFISTKNFDRLYTEGISREVKRYIPSENIEDYVKGYGLTHSSDVWKGNGKELLKKKIVTFDKLIANREDVYELLLEYNVSNALEITEYVRKGKVFSKGWKEEHLKELQEAKVPEWFLESCSKIRYLFPRAHAMGLFYNYRFLNGHHSL